ncbi:unnamed protein product [Merluccius merluccius]
MHAHTSEPKCQAANVRACSFKARLILRSRRGVAAPPGGRSALLLHVKLTGNPNGDEDSASPPLLSRNLDVAP